MATNILRQGPFFYKSNWTAEVDSLMLSVITKSKKMAEWDGMVIPFDVLEQVSTVITADTGLTFSWRELYEQFRFFEHRYHAFKMVHDTNGVYWNCNTNEVIAPDGFWEKLLKNNSLVAAYYCVGDPEYSRLAQLFGPTTVKVEQHSSGVVVISENTAPLGEEGTLPLPTSPSVEGSDYVCSPLITAAPKLRRKLFQGEGSNDGSKKDVNFKPPKPKRNTPMPSAFHHGSSCGSTSPSVWIRSAFN